MKAKIVSASWFVMNLRFEHRNVMIIRVRIYLMPLDQTCLLSLVSTRTSGVFICLMANFLISLMARGALLLKPTPWSRLCRLMVNSRVTTSFMALFLRSPLGFAIFAAEMGHRANFISRVPTTTINTRGVKTRRCQPPTWLDYFRPRDALLGRNETRKRPQNIPDYRDGGAGWTKKSAVDGWTRIWAERELTRQKHAWERWQILLRR